MSTRGRIVVIDDEVNAATALETLLREDGYEVASAHDARGGLLLLEKAEPDVVLTDLRMPGMDGLELLQKVKEVRPETMVILMTAYGTVKTAVKAMKLGAGASRASPSTWKSWRWSSRRSSRRSACKRRPAFSATGWTTSTDWTTWWARVQRCWRSSRPFVRC